MSVTRALAVCALGVLAPLAPAHDLEFLSVPQSFRAHHWNGDVLVLGGVNQIGLIADAVSVYEPVPSGGFLHLQTLSTPAGNGTETFGRAVAADGDLLVATQWGFDGLSSDTGTALAYRRAGTFWTFEKQLFPVAPGLVGGLGFGQAVDVLGDRVLVSSRADNLGAFPAIDIRTSTHVFRSVNGSWLVEGTLEHPGDTALTSFYGEDVALLDDWAFVSDVGNRRVLVYRRDGPTWTPATHLERPELGFGGTLDVEGDLLAVGMGDGNGGFSWLYRLVGGAWTLEAVVSSPVDPIGRDVALDGGRLYSAGFGGPDGVLHVFERCEGAWVETSSVFSFPFTRVEAAAGRVFVEGDDGADSGLWSVTGLALDELFTDVGGGTTAGVPRPTLKFTGLPCAGSPTSLVLQQARADAPAALALGVTPIAAPFKGGVLTVVPAWILDGFVTDGDGELSVPTIWPAGITGVPFGVQAWVVDDAVLSGLVGSLGLFGAGL